MKDALLILVGLLGAGFSIYEFWTFASIKGTDTGGTHLILAIVGAVIAIACGIMFGVGRVNKEEEIHITQQ